MAKELEVQVSRQLEGGCAADIYHSATSWEDAVLEIKWDATDKAFYVSFNGDGPTSVSTKNILSKKIPLEIARSSRCECGSTLELGDYRIIAKMSDFFFEGEFYCPVCKSERLAKKGGLLKAVAEWINDLKKIEIKANGVGFERK